MLRVSLLWLGLVIGHVAFGTVAAPSQSIREIAIDDRGHTYIATQKNEYKNAVIAVDANGQLDLGFADGGLFWLGYDRVVKSIDVSQGTIAVATGDGLILLDSSGTVLKELSGTEYLGSRLVRINSDGSLFWGTSRSSIYKLTPEFEFDASFGVNGELKVKEKSFSLDWIEDRQDDRNFIGVTEPETGLTIGCVSDLGTVCSEQDDFYVPKRFRSSQFRSFQLTGGDQNYTYAVGVSRDRTKLQRLHLDKDLKVLQDQVISFREPGYFEMSGYVPAVNANYVRAWYSQSQEYVAYKIGVDGQIDPTYGTNGEAVLNFPGYYFYPWTKMKPTQDGKVMFVGHCLEESKGYREGLCVVRLGTDGFFDKAFGDKGIAMLRLR